MEKQPSGKHPPLSPQEWEALIDDFQSGYPARRARWEPIPVLDLALAALLRRDFPPLLKPALLQFLEESAPLLSPDPLPALLDALRSPDAAVAGIRDQLLVAATSAAVSSLPPPPLRRSPATRSLESLVELLLGVANRPNHGPDRAARALACECLRELEAAAPRVLSDAAGHLCALAQAERTHAAGAYLLLVAAVVRNVVLGGLLAAPVSFLSTAAPLVPFAAPGCAFSPFPPPPEELSEPSDANLREIRRVMALLLERPRALTPPAAVELASALAGIAGTLELHVPAVAASLKVQFSGLLYSYDPLLCHVLLMLYCRFSDAFYGEDERAIARRLALFAKEAHQPLVFRLLSLHWLLGSPRLADGEASSLAPLAPCFYPAVFDPLALKAKKLDCLAYIAARTEDAGTEKGGEEEGEDQKSKAQVVKLIEDGLVCVSAFRWLPPWSTETSVAFRTLHKFLVGVAPHLDDGSENSRFCVLVDSTVYHTLQVLDMVISQSFA